MRHPAAGELVDERVEGGVGAVHGRAGRYPRHGRSQESRVRDRSRPGRRCPVTARSTSGSGRSAAEVTFVPGFMQRGEAWEPVAGRLGEGYRCTCLDLGTWTFEERVDEILAAVEPGGALVGYSMGGRLALHAALREPDRFGALVLVGVSAGIEERGEREDRRASDESLAEWMERRSIEEVVERWERQPVFETQPAELRAWQRPGRLSHDPE